MENEKSWYDSYSHDIRNIYEDLQRNDLNPEMVAETLQIEKEILEDRIYERYFPIEQGDVVVDIGAHVGVFVRSVVGRASRVYAVEPDPLFFKELSKNQSGKVVATHAAIAKYTGITTIKSDGHANAIGSEGETVACFSFREYLKIHEIEKIDVLKIDCEGAEYDLIHDNIEWLRDNCRKMVGEFHMHSPLQRKQLLSTLYLFERYGIDYVLTSIDGYELDETQLLAGINRFTEILFYAGELKKTPAVGGDEVIHFNFVKGATVDIQKGSGEYKVQFFDQGRVLYEQTIKGGHFAKCLYQYFIPYRILVTNVLNDQVVFDHTLNLEGKRVVVELDSRALGDTIAWFSPVEEFQLRHKCELYISTYNNNLFKDAYPNLHFMEPGTTLHNVYAWYLVGWSYTEDNKINKYRNPTDPRTRPMLWSAYDILGLIAPSGPWSYNAPRISFAPTEQPIEKPYVCIANHSTSQAKYWNNPTGWQEVVDHLNKKGFEVVLLSREADGHNGNQNPTGVLYPKDHNLTTIMNYLHYSEFFIGIGSGLSWLSWAMGIDTVVISGFSEYYTEPATIRISSPAGRCSGCFNRVRLQDDGDWNWCPDHKGGSRQFECSKLITGQQVINDIQPLLHHLG